MSKDEQVCTWDYFGDNSKNFSGGLNQPVASSFDFAQGPITKDQLLEWVDHPDYACPDVVQFDYQRLTELISNCLANREKVSHLGLPPVFWRLLEENLVKAENLWGFTLSDYIGWTKQGLSESPNQRESVFTTATQLHILFSSWYEKHGDSLSGTGEVVWDEVLSEVKFSQGRLDRIRVSFEGVEQPFFLWEVDYPADERPESTVTIQSPEIAAWFVLFSLHKVFRLFGLLVAELLLDPSDEHDAELTHYMFEYWTDIQAAMAVAQYWYDRIYSLGETLKEFNGRAQILANQFNSYEVGGEVKKPEIPYQAIGRVKLLNWFSRSNDWGMVELDVWMAHWAAINNELPPQDHGELKRYYTQWFESAKQSACGNLDLLAVLNRECEYPSSDLAGIAVMRLLCNSAGKRLSDDSAGKLLGAAKKKYVQFEESVKNYRKHYNSLTERHRRTKAKEAAKDIATAKLKVSLSKSK